MNTYLLTWNPKNSDWIDLPNHAKQTINGSPVKEQWSCGNTKAITKGDRLFLLKQGSALPKGIIGSGIAVSNVRKDEHWNDKEKSALYVDAEWDSILNPENEDPLPVSAFENQELPFVHWNTQKSGILIPVEVASVMELIWKKHVDAIRHPDPTISIVMNDSEEEEFPEGRVLYRLHRSRERNQNLIRKTKENALKLGKRLVCEVCEFDFFKTYGSVGEGFIECHHTVPVSELTDGMHSKISDMVLVCANCHRMLHRKRPWISVNELKRLTK